MCPNAESGHVGRHALKCDVVRLGRAERRLPTVSVYSADRNLRESFVSGCGRRMQQQRWRKNGRLRHDVMTTNL